MKKALFIMGGPRKKGNLASMLNIAMEKAKDAGYELHYVNLYEKKISPCIGCMKCKETCVCAIKDDINEIRELLIQCDLTVLASPTYFANVSGPVKNMFDRLVGAVMDDNNNFIPKPRLSSDHEYILMTTCNTPWPFNKIAGQSTGCIKAMKEFLNISGMKYRGKVVLAGTRNLNELPKGIENKIARLIK